MITRKQHWDSCSTRFLLCCGIGRYNCLIKPNKKLITYSLWDQTLPLYSGTRCRCDLQLQRFYPSVSLCQRHPSALSALPRIPICYCAGQTAPLSSGESCHQNHLQRASILSNLWPPLVLVIARTSIIRLIPAFSGNRVSSSISVYEFHKLLKINSSPSCSLISITKSDSFLQFILQRVLFIFFFLLEFILHSCNETASNLE